MFKTEDRGARSVARLVFGFVVLGGAWLLVQRRLDHVPLHAAKLIAGTWSLAFVAAWVTRQLVSAARPAMRDLGAISYVVPTFGIALLLPLTIHLPLAMALGGTGNSFDEWVELSLCITPVAHAAFAGMAATRAYQIAKGRPALSTRTIFVATITVSGVPFAFMLFIPPILVGLTGIPIALLLRRMPMWIERDDEAPLPTAIVV